MIADYPPRELMPDPKTWLIIAIRVLLLPLACVLVFKLLGAPYSLTVLAVLSVSCPCGMNSVVYPAAHSADCKLGVELVWLSSMAAVITLPLLYAITTQIVYR